MGTAEVLKKARDEIENMRTVLKLASKLWVVTGKGKPGKGDEKGKGKGADCLTNVKLALVLHLCCAALGKELEKGKAAKAPDLDSFAQWDVVGA